MDGENNNTEVYLKVREWQNRQMILSRALKSVLDETDCRIDTIVEMVEDHGMRVIDEARGYVGSDEARRWDFNAFLIGAKAAVIHQLRGRISDRMILELAEIVPDDSRYGCVVSCGRCDEQVAALFMDMLTDGVVEERMGELISYDVEQQLQYALDSKRQGEPEDDVDLDNLLEGLTVMMEGHGVTGDVRTKAREFLAAVAMDALNEVIHEDE